MEINGYLPSRVRVFSNENGEFQPQILAEAIDLELDGLDMDKVYAYKDENRNEDLFKYLLIIQCNALNKILPCMFEKLSDYTELLLPDYLLREGSVLDHLVNDIKEEDWQDQVQIIGWLYQYYNTEPKNKVFADLKKNIKVSKENIPAATQLFTPDWIVRYMVENSLGRLWLEGHPSEELQEEWKYYLEEVKQEPDVAKKLAELRRERANINPEDIKIIDPCMGSGHILAYAFDVLIQIYESQGYKSRDAVKSIITNNLYGLDIDQRAFQLAYFAVMMKGRQYDSRFFTRGAVPQVYAIEESNGMQKWSDMLGAAHVDEKQITFDGEMITLADEVIDIFHDAKEYGSILDVPVRNYDGLIAYMQELMEQSTRDLFLAGFVRNWGERVVALVQQAKVMSQKYDVCVTNPPYMGLSSGDTKINAFVKKNYPASKGDLFAVFIEKCGEMLKNNSYQAMITQHAWMFLSSFEKLRKKILEKSIVNMAHLGARAFDEIGGEVVQTTSFVLGNNRLDKYKGTYARLIEANSETAKQEMFLNSENRFVAEGDNFDKIPGSPVAYWISGALISTFNNINMDSISESRMGLTTGNNDYYLRMWYEVSFKNIGIGFKRDEAEISGLKWFPYNKGGEYRKWYGNIDFVVNWYKDGFEMRNKLHPDGKRIWAHNFNLEYNFMKHITWTDIITGGISFRFFDDGFLFDSSAAVVFPDINKYMYVLGLLNTKYVDFLSKLLNPTLHFKLGDFAKIPYIENKKDEVEELVKENIWLSQTDWDTFETSWDFEVNPLVLSHNLSNKPIMMGGRDIRKGTFTLEEYYKIYKTNTNGRFRQLKENEEELNEIFIDIYGLQDELTPEVANKDVTIASIFDTKEEIPESFKGNNYVLTREDVIKNLISYAVGCMFGRYSTDPEHYGLVYAGGDGWQEAMEKSYTAEEIARGIPDADSILPICEDDYFNDDITSLFIDWMKLTFGSEHLEENLKFIADSLSTKGNNSRSVIRNYFLNDFYKDHTKKYQKRPIYWLFDSGKNNGFKALIYMHRYDKNTIARVRTDYVHEQQSRYRTAIEALERQLETASTSEKAKINKQLTSLRAKAEETRTYEEKIHHLADQMISIDLDDGVKVNYAKFQDVLAKIK